MKRVDWNRFVIVAAWGLHGGCQSATPSSLETPPSAASVQTETSGLPARRALAFPVEVAPVAAARVEYAISAVGSVEAYEKVSVTARVPGVVERVLFTEGDLVKRGQVLAEIELQRYVLAVDAAQATLQRAQAAKAEADAGLQRRERALEATPGIIPGEELSAWRTRSQTMQAEVKQAQVSLAQAELNLRDAQVRAPLGGVVQTREVQTGAYIQVGTPLATLLQREPLLLRFLLPEADAGRVHPPMTARFRIRGEVREYSAKIIHVAAAAETSTRMVTLVARVQEAKDTAVRPGTFAEITIPIGAEPRAAVVPQAAVRSSERGFLAYVVVDGKVTERRLELGMRTADGRVEVRRGLALGESLVIRGVEALTDGARVTVVAPPALREVAEGSLPSPSPPTSADETP